MSQPPKTRSFKPASETNSLILGTRFSVRFPSRIVPSWVSEPTGCAIFFLIASTPAMNVVLTAPIPGIRTPSFPAGASILTPFCTTLPPDRSEHYRLQIAQITRICPYNLGNPRLVIVLRNVTALGPTGPEVIAIHPRNHLELDFFWTYCFAFS